jgi:hypothetical protein
MKDLAEHYFQKGFDFFKMGHYTKSLVSCDVALATRPDYTDARNGRGVTLALARTGYQSRRF